MVVLAAVLTFVHGVVLALRFFLRDRNAQGVGLSAVEWIAYTLGPFLISPVLLFGVLYYVGTSADELPPVSGLLPGLLIAVTVGGVLGQFVGGQLLATGWTPVAQARIDVLIAPDPRSLPYWRDLVEPPVQAVLTAVAAIALAGSSDT